MLPGQENQWKILYIDDDEDEYVLIRAMICDVWKECVEVYWHAKPEGAIEKVCSNQFHATLIDSHLDSTSGLALLEQIGKACSDAVLIFLADWPGQEIIDQAIGKGAKAALHKGEFTSQILAETILKNVLKSRTDSK